MRYALVRGNGAARSTSVSAGSSPFEHVRRATDELRAAVREYEFAIAADPSEATNHYQLVQALSMLGQAHDAIARYCGRDDLVSLRCLAQAYVADGRWPEAKATIARAPDDAFMLEQQAEMFSRTAVLKTTPSGPSKRSPGCGHQHRSEHRFEASL